MSASELKKKIQSRIEHADNNLLRMVNALLDAYDSEEEIAGYTVNGDPISQADLKKRVKEAEQRMSKGDYLSHEELKNEFGL